MFLFSWFLNKLDFGVFKARTLLWAHPGLCLTHMASKRSPKLVLKASKKVVKKWITKMVQNVIKKGAKKVHKRWTQIVKNRSDRTLFLATGPSKKCVLSRCLEDGSRLLLQCKIHSPLL